MRHALVTGGSGWIGSRLVDRLLRHGWRVSVVSRDPRRVSARWGNAVAGLRLADVGALRDVDAVVNLAGAPIADRPWTRGRRELLRNSRIALTEELIERMAKWPHPPAVFVSASAIGYYGDTGEAPQEEHTPVSANDFAHALCRDWEQATEGIQRAGCRLCILRIGLVIGPGGGLLQRMALPFRLGLGARLGNGRQWMSWVHLEDVLGMLQHALEDENWHGVYNATAPNPVRNIDFTRALARSLGRPAFLAVPAPLLKLALGELSILLLGGQRVLPARAQAAGYSFRHPELAPALAAIRSGDPGPAA